MSLRYRNFLLLFLPTFLFLTFFSGFYFYLYFYYLNDSYMVWYSFNGGQPSDMEMVFSGFKNFRGMGVLIILAALFSFLGGVYLREPVIKTRKRTILFNGIILALLLGGLYLLYNLLPLAGSNQTSSYYQWHEIKYKTLIFTTCYLGVAVLLSYLFYKQTSIQD